MNGLILVDLQNDFMPGGALAVTEGDAVVPIANGLMPHFDLVVATQDWHPADHSSFASQHDGRQVGELVELEGIDQRLWPDHCVQESAGAEFHELLNFERVDHVVRKGSNRLIDSYSGFFDNDHRQATGLADMLREASVNEVFLLGLATDYCVKFTALDAVELGFATFLIEDGCRGVDLKPDDVESAVSEMKERGIKVISSDDAIKIVSQAS